MCIRDRRTEVVRSRHRLTELVAVAVAVVMSVVLEAAVVAAAVVVVVHGRRQYSIHRRLVRAVRSWERLRLSPVLSLRHSPVRNLPLRLHNSNSRYVLIFSENCKLVYCG